MTTDTLTKPVTSTRLPARFDSPLNSPNYESAYLPQPIEYPDSDGQPMAESDSQRKPLSYAVEALDIFFQDRPDAYVTGNIFLYFQKGDPTDVVSPDVFVVFGAEKRDRRSYKLWEEPKAPDFILEITSGSTRSKDQGTKKGLYQFLGVTEYFCYDPTGDYLDPALIGFQLQEGRYVPIAPKKFSSASIVVPSTILGLDLQVADHTFRFVDQTTGLLLPSHREERSQRIAAEQRASEAEARVRELEEQMAAMRKPN
ncbi:MAG: Uma2 family endonuclease [Planctomycetaceae bacterium]